MISNNTQADMGRVKDNLADNPADVVLVIKDSQADMAMQAADVKMGVAMIPKDRSSMVAPDVKGGVMRSMAKVGMVRAADINHRDRVVVVDISPINGMLLASQG
jgi:hypothetical protein